MILAIDTGGTKTLMALVSDDGSIQRSTKIQTPKDLNEYRVAVEDAIRNDFDDDEFDTVVLALPGVVEGGIAIWCDNLGWRDFDAGTFLVGLFPDKQVFVENDANLAGLAEAIILSGQNSDMVTSLYLTISTGIGSGVIVNGVLSKNSIRNCEAGHMVLEYGGKYEEWEDFASGKAILEHYGMVGTEIKEEGIWRDIADRISRGFLVLIPTILPDVVVVGGSMGTHFERYAGYLDMILSEHLPSNFKKPKIVKAVNPEEAVIYGCYYYAKDQLTSRTA